jgi:hypothetical protein
VETGVLWGDGSISRRKQPVLLALSLLYEFGIVICIWCLGWIMGVFNIKNTEAACLRYTIRMYIGQIKSH